MSDTAERVKKIVVEHLNRYGLLGPGLIPTAGREI